MEESCHRIRQSIILIVVSFTSITVSKDQSEGSIGWVGDGGSKAEPVMRSLLFWKQEIRVGSKGSYRAGDETR